MGPADAAALLLDLNGVLYDEGGVVGGAVATVAEARRRGLAIRYVTNTATRHHHTLERELEAMGFAVQAGELFTAPLAALAWLQRQRRHPFCLVHESIAPLYAPLAAERPDCVLLGDARHQLSYANLSRALELLLEGAPLIGIGMNRRFREGGRWLLDAGAFIRALEYGADCQATVMGKPAAAFYQELVQSLGLPPQRCLMLGDDVEADVAGAMACGLQAVLVQSGKYREADRKLLPPGAGLIADISALGGLLGW
ncbi:MAG: TIGR01458 family HAD-type hydrolase [Cyanobacteria bacterium J06638_7]